MKNDARVENLALEPPFPFVCRDGKTPMAWDRDGRRFVQLEGAESYECLDGEIPDFRVSGRRVSADEIANLHSRLDELWKQAENSQDVADRVRAASHAEELCYRLAMLKMEIIGAAKWGTRGFRPYTQRQSMEMYKSVTDVYPHAEREQVWMYMNDRLAQISLLGLRRMSLEPLAELVRKENVQSIVDYGCGWGLNTIVLKEWFPDIELWSFDYSPFRVLSARYNLRKLGLVPYRLFIADGSRLPLPDDSVDLVFTHHVLEQMNEVLDAALREIHRVARRFAVHVEPSMRYGSPLHRLRILRKGYPRDLLGRARKFNWVVREYRAADPTWAATPAEWVVLEKA